MRSASGKMATLNIIGGRLRAARESRNLTQDQLAAACQRLGWDLSRVSVAKIETGARGLNDAELVVLGLALKTDPGEFLKGLKLAKLLKVVRQGKSEKG